MDGLIGPNWVHRQSKRDTLQAVTFSIRESQTKRAHVSDTAV